MAPAKEDLRAALEKIQLSPSTIPVISNVSASPYCKQTAKRVLVDQIVSPVLWEKTIEKLVLEYHCDKVVVFGPKVGGILQTHLKQIGFKGNIEVLSAY